MGSGWSNFSSIFSDLGKGIWDGVTGNEAQANRDFHNYVQDGHNLDYGLSNSYNRQYSPEEIAQQQAVARQASLNPNASWNKGNWQSVTTTARNVSYGPQSGNSGITPPSQVMAISNPAMKTAIAQSRGQNRSMLQAVNNSQDVKLSSAFSNAPTSTGGPSNAPSASGTSGTMPQTSLDAKQQA
jgi:hypothetical protein